MDCGTALAAEPSRLSHTVIIAFVAELAATQQVERHDADHGDGGGGNPLLVGPVRGPGAAQQRQVHRIAADPRPYPSFRVGLRQDAEAARDLAHADGPHHLPVFVVVRNPDQPCHPTRRRDLCQSQSQAEPAQALRPAVLRFLRSAVVLPDAGRRDGPCVA